MFLYTIMAITTMEPSMVMSICPMLIDLNLVIKSFAKRSVPPVEIRARTDKDAAAPYKIPPQTTATTLSSVRHGKKDNISTISE